MFEFIKTWFKKEEKKEVVIPAEDIEYDLEHGDLKRIFLNGKNFKEEDLDPNKKTILFVDDYIEMSTLLKNTIRDMNDEFDIDIESMYNVVFAIGDNCGKDSLTFIENHRVDYAILDITLREIIKKTINGKSTYGAVNGIDIGIEIRERYSDCKLLFLTAHNLDTKNDKFHMLHKKFYDYFGDDLSSHYLNKLDPDRNKIIIEFIRETKDVDDEK